ncbi:unnamed protein product, partial [Ilex paraguariensis]
AIIYGLGSKTSPDELYCTLIEIDTDRDDFIDLKEFTEFHREDRIQTATRRSFHDAFDMYDKDKNDFISVIELHTMLLLVE